MFRTRKKPLKFFLRMDAAKNIVTINVSQQLLFKIGVLCSTVFNVIFYDENEMKGGNFDSKHDSSIWKYSNIFFFTIFPKQEAEKFPILCTSKYLLHLVDAVKTDSTMDGSELLLGRQALCR